MVPNYDRRLDEKIKKYPREIDRIVAEENEIYLCKDLGENSCISAEQVEVVVKSIDKKLTENPKDKVLKKKVREFKRISFLENRNMRRHLPYLKKATTIKVCLYYV